MNSPGIHCGRDRFQALRVARPAWLRVADCHSICIACLLNIRSHATEFANHKGDEQSVQLHQVAQHADDLDRAVAFYSDVLGCEFITKINPPGLAFLRLGTVRLLLDKAAPSALIYLRVDDVRATAETLRAAGVPIDTEPHLINTDTDGIFGEAGWEEWMTFVRDSEGNLVGLASRHAPPEPPR